MTAPGVGRSVDWERSDKVVTGLRIGATWGRYTARVRPSPVELLPGPAPPCRTELSRKATRRMGVPLSRDTRATSMPWLITVF